MTLEKDVKRTIRYFSLIQWSRHFEVEVGELVFALVYPFGKVCLTCTLAANQVLTLRLIRVNGCDCNVIQSVWVQVCENMRCLLAAQDSLERERD